MGVGILHPALRGLGGGIAGVYGAADKFPGVVVGVGSGEVCLPVDFPGQVAAVIVSILFYRSVVNGLSGKVAVDIVGSPDDGAVRQSGSGDGAVVWSVFIGAESYSISAGSLSISAIYRI